MFFHALTFAGSRGCINICRVPRMLFEQEGDRPNVQQDTRDRASVNAMKQICVIAILAYFILFQPHLL